MRILFKTLLIVFTIGLGFSIVVDSVFMQSNANQVKTLDKNDSCIELLLISNSKVELEKDNPISFVIKVYNKCNTDITLKYEPLFKLVKTSVDDKPKSEYKYRDLYTGRIISFYNADSKSKSIDIKSGEFIDYTLTFNDIDWKIDMSSQDTWDSIFGDLANGEYYLKAKITTIEPIEKVFYSDKILVSYCKGKSK